MVKVYEELKKISLYLDCEKSLYAQEGAHISQPFKLFLFHWFKACNLFKSSSCKKYKMFCTFLNCPFSLVTRQIVCIFSLLIFLCLSLPHISRRRRIVICISREWVTWECATYLWSDCYPTCPLRAISHIWLFLILCLSRLWMPLDWLGRCDKHVLFRAHTRRRKRILVLKAAT